MGSDIPLRFRTEYWPRCPICSTELSEEKVGETVTILRAAMTIAVDGKARTAAQSLGPWSICGRRTVADRDRRKDPQKDDEFLHERGDWTVIERYACKGKQMVRFGTLVFDSRWSNPWAASERAEAIGGIVR